MNIAVQLLRPGARLPRRAHPDDAGADLYAAEAALIPPGQRRDVGTGIALALPAGYAGLVMPRSGLAFRHGIMIVNAPGLIDANSIVGLPLATLVLVVVGGMAVGCLGALLAARRLG